MGRKKLESKIFQFSCPIMCEQRAINHIPEGSGKSGKLHRLRRNPLKLAEQQVSRGRMMLFLGPKSLNGQVLVASRNSGVILACPVSCQVLAPVKQCNQGRIYAAKKPIMRRIESGRLALL